MATELPFDLDALVHEPESETRARHASVEWGSVSPEPVRNDDFTLGPDFEPYTPSKGRVDRFTASYEDLPIHVMPFEDGVVFGGEFLVCDRRVPTYSDERPYRLGIGRLLGRRDELERLDVADGPTYLVGASSHHRAFYHWCHQCLPGIALLRQEARRRGLDYRIVLPPLDRVRRRMLELLGVEAAECVTLEAGRFISGVPMLYTNASSGDFVFQPSARLATLLEPYRRACLERASPNLPTRFYLSRRDAGSRRALENEAELVDVMRARGHEELVMSELSIEDQVSAFAHAESIVAPHGAGLVHLMFASPKARLVEIMPENYRHACFFRLAQLAGMRYSMVLSDVAREAIDRPEHSSVLRVDVDKVVAALERSSEAVASRAA